MTARGISNNMRKLEKLKDMPVSRLDYWMIPLLHVFMIGEVYRQKKVTYIYQNGDKKVEYYLEHYRFRRAD